MSSSSDMHSASSYRVALETLRAMRRQEAHHYPTTTEHLEQETYHDIPLYLEWRKAMIAWNFSIAQTCKFRKDTVEIAMSLVDRFVATQTDLLSQAHRYQVACMASLYIAAKIHEQQCLTPQQMETLSCGRFRAGDIESMERELLMGLQWRVNPPTAASFCRSLLELVPLELVPDRETVLEVAETYIQLPLSEEFFLAVDSSSLAVASLRNALRCVVGEQPFMNDFMHHAYDDMSTIDIRRIEELQQELRLLASQSLNSGVIVNEAMSRSEDPQPMDVSYHNKSRPVSPSGSPRSVTEKRRYVQVQVV